MSTLAQWIGDAWHRHDRESASLAAELHALAATLPDDDDGAQAVRLARHTLLSHLGDAAGLQRFVAALPPGAKLQEQADQVAWALATLDDGPAPPLPERAAWGALGDVVQAEILRGHLSRARERALAPESAAAAHPDEAARRAYAVMAHNAALALRNGPRSPAHDALMIEMAELERRAWSSAGTWLQVERADYHLALCHAVAGHGAQAVAHASACLAACEANGADAAERFFAHECSVHAANAAGDTEAAARHRARMVDLLAEVQDAEMKVFCEETLASTPIRPAPR